MITVQENYLINPNKIPYLDGWRGTAILFVLISHFGFGGNSWTGEFGVLLFFVLSGSLMANLLFIKKVKFKNFFVRRASRVLPVFVLFVITMAIVNNCILSAPFRVSSAELIATLFFLRTYLPVESSIWEAHWPIGHLWSLNVEEHSYAVMAILAFLCRSSKIKWLPSVLLSACTCLVFITGIYYASHPPSGSSPWYLHSECASLGLIGAATLRVIRSRCEGWKPHPALPVLAIILAVACFVHPTSYRLEKTLAPFCLAFSLVYLDRGPAFLKELLSLGLLQKMGIWSFSLYIWQQPFFSVMGKYKLSSLFMALAAISVGIASFYLYENWVRIYLNQAWAKQQAKFLDLRSFSDRVGL